MRLLTHHKCAAGLRLDGDGQTRLAQLVVQQVAARQSLQVRSQPAQSDMVAQPGSTYA